MMETKVRQRKPRKQKPLPQIEVVTMRPSQIEQGYGIKPGTLYNMFKEGLPYIKRNGREGRKGMILVRKADLEAFLDANVVTEA